VTKMATVHAQQRWEYCTETRRTDSALLTALGERGQQGWELANVVHYKDAKGDVAWTGFLKRPSAASAPAATSQTTVAAKPPAAEISQPAGFDLSGAEFQIKTE
jgi:hypothetical protein